MNILLLNIIMYGVKSALYRAFPVFVLLLIKYAAPKKKEKKLTSLIRHAGQSPMHATTTTTTFSTDS